MKKILFFLISALFSIAAANAQVPGVGNPPLGWGPSRFDSNGVAIDAPVLLTTPDPTGAPGGRVVNFDTPEFDVDDNGPTGTLDIHLGTPLQYFHDTGATTNQAALNAFTNVAGRATGDLFQWNGTNFARLPIGIPGDLLTVSGGGLASWVSPAVGAPASANYVVTTLDGTLTNDHLITGGDGIDVNVGVGTCDVQVDSTVIRTTGAQSMAGPKTLSGGPIISGAHSTGLVLEGSTSSTTIKTDPGSARIQTIPDVADGSFIMTQGASTKVGVLTLSASPVLSTNTITGSGANTVTLFTSSDTVVGKNTTDVLTNKELTSPSFTNNATGFTMKGSGSNTFVHTWAPGAAGQTITWANPNGNVDVAYKSGAATANGVAYGIGNNTASFTAAGTTGQVLTATTGSAPTWATPSGGGAVTGVTTTTLTGSSATYETIATGSQTITLPDAATNSGKVFWFHKGGSSAATIQRAGSDTIQTTGGTANSVSLAALSTCGLVSDGSTTWKQLKSAPLTIGEGGTNSTSFTQGGVLYANFTATAVASVAGSTGQVLCSGGTGAPTWSTATYPATAGTSGKVLISNGTNIVSSTPTYPNAATTSGALIRADGTNFVAASPPSIKRKAADTSRNSTTTVTDDPDLLFAVAANEVWDFEAHLFVISADATPDFKFTCTGPSGSTVTYAGIRQDDSGNATSIAATAGGTTTLVNMGSSQLNIITISGTCTNGATPGNLSIQWAQNVSNATNTTLKAGSFMSETLR